jgi:hypothetical protein
MAMDALPAATLEVIPAKFFFRLTKAGFNLPTTEGDPKQLAKRPATTTRNSIAKEVLHFAAENMLGNQQRALSADQFAAMCLAPASVPADLPYLGTLVGIFNAVALCPLLGETG